MSAAPINIGSTVTPESPWLGLRSFTEDAHAFFFGRSAELNDLYERIVDKPLTILFGQSGLGKSSLLQAALIPRLRAAGYLPVLIRLDHEAEAPLLERQLLGQLQTALHSAGYTQRAATLDTALTDASAPLDCATSLWLLFHDPAYGFVPARGVSSEGFPRPVFLIDQFEEIFTLGERPARRNACATFRETLAALVENRPPASLRAMLEEDDALAERLDYQARHARVLLSLRYDFLNRLERWRRIMPSLMENRFELRMLSGPQALQAVVRPGQLRPGLPAIIPDGVGEAIVRFVAGKEDDVPLSEIDAVPPLLSLVCAELNANRRSSGEEQLTQAHFEGHSKEILSTFYLRSFDLATYAPTLDSVSNAEPVLKTLRGFIEDRLLSNDGFRESIAFNSIAHDLANAAGPETAKAVLDAIVERRLLTIEERGGVRRIELTHDVLVPIVKASRDERHEVEALARAKSDQQRAEAETARILKERNRLKRLAILAACLACVAATGATLGWIGLNSSKEARDRALASEGRAIEAAKQATSAKNQAIDSEKEAIHYAAQTLENTHGISGSETRAINLKLREHLLEQLRKRNQEDPDHRDTIHDITQLLLADARDAVLDKSYARANDKLVEALQWSTKLPLNSVAEAEAHAEIMVLHAVAQYYVAGARKGLETALNDRPKILNFASAWPDSWRLEYLTIRLENVINLEVTNNRQMMATLANKLLPLCTNSTNHFEPTIWHFILMQNSFRGEGAFNRSSADYSLAKDLIVWFREHLVQNNAYSLVQLEDSVKRFDNFLSFLQTQFSLLNIETTKELRRNILTELEKTLKEIEARLPKNTIVYGARGNLLTLQEASIKDGVNTRSADELLTAGAKHRAAAAALGVGSVVGDLIATAFKDYSSEKAGRPAIKGALAKVESYMQDFMSLDLAGTQTVLQNDGVRAVLDKLREIEPKDPLLTVHGKMVERYVHLYQGASRDAKADFVDGFANASAPMVESWFTNGQHEEISVFWQKSYYGLPIPTFTSGDKQSFVTQLNRCIRALVKTGRFAEGKRLLDDTLKLCDSILGERPWDWYVKDAYQGLCFGVAATLSEVGEKDSVQPLLKRGWTVAMKQYGEERLLVRYRELPLKGEVPPNAPIQDAEFFARFKEQKSPEELKKSKLKRFTVPTDFSGTKYPFHVYVLGGPNGYAELQDQFRWVKEIRGGTVPIEVQDSFRRLNDIAVSNKVDFMELCVYALGTTDDAAQKRLDSAIDDFKRIEALHSAEKSVVNRDLLAGAYNTAAYRALFVRRWSDAESWSRKALAIDPKNRVPDSNLATALLFQGKFEAAIQVYRACWNEPFKDGTLGDAILDDFRDLENVGITHPNVARIRAEFPPRSTLPKKAPDATK